MSIPRWLRPYLSQYVPLFDSLAEPNSLAGRITFHHLPVPKTIPYYNFQYLSFLSDIFRLSACLASVLRGRRCILISLQIGLYVNTHQQRQLRKSDCVPGFLKLPNGVVTRYCGRDYLITVDAFFSLTIMASSEFDWSPGAPYDAAVSAHAFRGGVLIHLCVKLIKTLAPPPPLYFPTLPTPRSIKAAANDGRRIANLFLRSCLTVKTTRTLDQLSQRVRDNASLAKSQGAAALLEALRAHDKECDDILGKGFVNPFSTLYIDRQGVRILAYLAYPHPDGKGEEEHILLRTFLQGGHIYSTQYFEGLGESSDLDYQGLPVSVLISNRGSD